MAIKLSGLISGMDTDSMIDELVKAYSTRKDSYVKQQKALEYKQDAWKEMNTKIYSLFSGKLSNLRFSSGYALKSVKASNENKVTVSGNSSAVNGTQELKITSLAKSGYLTGGVVSSTSGEKLTGSSKLSELGVTSGRINVTVEGKETYIDVTGDMTLNEFAVQLKERGLNASFDETNQRFFVSAKTSGADHDFSISGNDAAGTAILQQMGLYVVSTADISAYQGYIDAANADAEYIANLAKSEYLNSVINDKVSSLKEEKSTYEATIKDINEKISSEKEKKTFAALSEDKQSTKITELNDKIAELQQKIADEEAKGDEADSAALTGYNEELASLQEEVALYEEIKTAVETDGLEAYNATIDEKIAELEGQLTEPNEKIAELTEQITTVSGYSSLELSEKEASLTEAGISYDYTGEDYETYLAKYEDKLTQAQEMVADYEEYQSLKESGSTDTDRIAELEAKLGLSQGETGAVRIAGADAKITLNGAVFESNTNNFSINGLTVTVHALTNEDETISVTTETDVDGIYNMVKDFFTEYNEVMKAMEEAYNAASAGDYEPLTDEEMESLTDKQIEKWETKIKDAVLRRDSTLSSIISLFKTNMMKSFEVDGESLTLASFGIKTLGYFDAAENERGLYHIDGDPDDSAVSGNTDKLKAAIASDPDKFISFFSQLTENLYTQLNKKMSTSTLSSAYTVYNDKYMKQQYEDYDDTISEWEDKLDAIREKYEQQFAAMETALSELQSQSSYLSSMLGY